VEEEERITDEMQKGKEWQEIMKKEIPVSVI
jgi:hypothetical protein